MLILKSLYHSLASLRISDAELVRHALKSLSAKRLLCNSCNQTGSLKIQSHYHRYCIHAVNGRRMEERPYFMAYPLCERQKVKFVCCDMHGGYITLARECFPCATVCVDPFHVVRRVSDALDEVRIRVQRELQEAGRSDDYKSLKDCAKILRTAGRNHEKYWAGKAERNEERIRRALSLSSDLEVTYDAYQDFLAILDVNEYSLQRLDLGDWIRKYTASMVPEIAFAANTVRHYRGYFQNSLKYHKSNSVAGGRNRAIKEIKRNSYGRHSFENFRKRILMAFGPTQMQEETYTVFGEKRASSGRT